MAEAAAVCTEASEYAENKALQYVLAGETLLGSLTVLMTAFVVTLNIYRKVAVHRNVKVRCGRRHLLCNDCGILDYLRQYYCRMLPVFLWRNCRQP